MSPHVRPPATPESHLKDLRAAQKADAKRIREIERRMKDRGDDLASWKREDARVDALDRHGVERPWLVITEAERAEASVGELDTNFLAISLAVLHHETAQGQSRGPFRAVFGCDHGPQSGRPPYCGDAVTHDRGRAFLKALHGDVWANMNGVHWTQTTWYEKVFRVERLSADLTDPGAHLRVCLGDLALLIKSRGVHDGVMAYNGAGPAAEQYAREVLNDDLPIVRGWLPDRKR